MSVKELDKKGKGMKMKKMLFGNTTKRGMAALMATVLAGSMLAGCGSTAATETAPADTSSSSAATEAAPEAAPEAVDPVVIKFAHMNSDADAVHLAAEQIKANVEERTGGAVQIEIYPSGQLGENKEVLEQARLGSNIMGQFGVGHLEEYVPDYGIFLHPFMFNSWDEAKKVTESDLVAGWEAELEAEHDIVVLGYANFGVRDFYTINKPIEKPEDLAGMSIRVQPVKMYTEMIGALGAAPQTISWMEVYSALTQGVVDGAEAPPSSMLDQKHNEVAKYFSVTEHMMDVVPFCIGMDTYNELTAEQQAILKEETVAATAWMSEEVMANAEAQIQQIEDSGVTVIRDIDKKPFQEATANISEAFPEWSDGLYETIMAVINE